jgi:hypothetical protein
VARSLEERGQNLKRLALQLEFDATLAELSAVGVELEDSKPEDFTTSLDRP